MCDLPETNIRQKQKPLMLPLAGDIPLNWGSDTSSEESGLGGRQGDVCGFGAAVPRLLELPPLAPADGSPWYQIFWCLLVSVICSVMSDSLLPRGLQPQRHAWRACVRAGPGGWAEGRGGLGALPPRASPGPAALGEPGLPGSRSLLRAVSL